VEQRLDYRVTHEPQRSFALLAPRELAAMGDKQIWFNDEPLALGSAPEAEATGPLARLEFSAPTEQIGAFQVFVRYALPLRNARGEATPLTIPLVVPAAEGDYQFSGQKVDFLLEEGLQIVPDLEGVDELARPTIIASSPTGHSYTWSKAANFSHWTLEPTEQGDDSAIAIMQMWVQTWLSPQLRQDRVAFRLRSPQETIRVRLPPGAKPGSVQTAIDGQETNHIAREPGLLVVSLPSAKRGRECVLEVCYSADSPALWLGTVSANLATARLAEAGAPRRVYWQLALPEDEHLVTQPPDLAAEMAWSVDRFPLSRSPILDQR
jgi:hypothetical protein